MSTAIQTAASLVDSCTANRQLPFESATTPTSLAALVVLIGLIHLLRSHVFRPVLRRIGARLGSWTHGREWTLQNEESIENFSNFGFRLLFRLVVTGLGVWEFWRSPEWWYDTTLLWEGYPHHFVSNTVQIIYLLQLAYHLEDLGAVLIEGNHNRKDFGAMLIHHVVTALLLFGSTHLKVTRIGTIVSTLHAVTDVPKDLAKVAKTLEWDLASKLGFGTLVLTWIVARLYLYPMVYVKSAFLESGPLLEGGMSADTLRAFHVLLSVLIGLNVMWFHMMVKLVHKLIKGGKAEDPTLLTKQSAANKLASSSSQDETDCDDDSLGSLDSISDSDIAESLTDDDSGLKEE